MGPKKKRKPPARTQSPRTRSRNDDSGKDLKGEHIPAPSGGGNAPKERVTVVPHDIAEPKVAETRQEDSSRKGRPAMLIQRQNVWKPPTASEYQTKKIKPFHLGKKQNANLRNLFTGPDETGTKEKEKIPPLDPTQTPREPESRSRTRI